jgi:hypothetical protein
MLLPMLRLFQASSFALAAVMPFGAAGAVASNSAEVAAVQSAAAADLVLLNRGFDAGFRQGMICRITRGGAEVAEVLLVGLRPSCSAALITSLVPGQSVRAGDIALIKTLKT